MHSNLNQINIFVSSPCFVNSRHSEVVYKRKTMRSAEHPNWKKPTYTTQKRNGAGRLVHGQIESQNGAACVREFIKPRPEKSKINKYSARLIRIKDVDCGDYEYM